ncbi:hypothetical protein C8R43DRAFT_889469 [Mycena crocata]|nr:hypothetical protein C8R43DRAFT_889469 [Mycena crocata]
MNPFTLGWSTSQSGSHQLPTWGTQPVGHAPPPPPPTSHSTSRLLTFTFNSFDSTVLNSSLVGWDNRTYFHIATSSAPARTVVEDASHTRVGMITWNTRPIVGIDDLGWTKLVSRWLSLSADRACRTMEVEDQTFMWQPNSRCIEVCTVIQLTPGTIQRGLLKVVVVSAVLLISGRSID